MSTLKSNGKPKGLSYSSSTISMMIDELGRIRRRRFRALLEAIAALFVFVGCVTGLLILLFRG